MIAGVITTLIYILGTVSVLVAVPAEAVAERSGVTEVIDLVSSRIGLIGFGVLTGALIAIGQIAGVSAWASGAARVSFAAGLDRVMPEAMARLHPKHQTPHVALIVQAIISSLILLVSLFFTIAGGQTTIQEAYDILVNLTIIIYFIPYLYLFPALVRLRKIDPVREGDEAVLVPGGRAGLWTIAAAGLARHADLTRPRLRPTVRHDEHAQLRSEPDPAIADRDRRGRRPLLDRTTPPRLKKRHTSEAAATDTRARRARGRSLGPPSLSTIWRSHQVVRRHGHGGGIGAADVPANRRRQRTGEGRADVVAAQRERIVVRNARVAELDIQAVERAGNRHRRLRHVFVSR